ncbi:MAG: hypothetical protein RSD06_04945 [Bacilli bacterium]
MNKKKFMMIFLSVVIIFVLILTVIIDKKNKEKDIIDNDNNGNVIEKPSDKISNPELVEDYDRFFTIENCIKTYYSYLYNNEYEKALLLLNPEYVKTNNITIENNKPSIDDENESYTYSARKIYKEKLKHNITRYYVYGNLAKNILDEKPKYIDNYIIVYLDENTLSFSVEHYIVDNTNTDVTNNLKEMIKKVKKLYNEDTNFVNKNEFNKYNVTHLSNSDICNKYYYNMKNLFILDYEESKSKITNNSSVENISSYFKGTITKYSLSGNNSNLKCIIIDSNNLKYTFNISYVLEYSVTLDTFNENN